jgi:hypothetical protein
MPLPSPSFATAPEPFAPYWGEAECTPDIERAGVSAFRDFVLRHQGGGWGHSWRPCGATGLPSGHYSSRAWDWMIRADDPAERAAADELVEWLLANDGEMFRRAGLVYLIWNRQSWAGYRPEGDRLRTYTRANPHTDHVHFSFSPEGADGLTSFYRWLDGGPELPVATTPPTPNPHVPLAPSSPWPAVVGLCAGLATVLLVDQRPELLGGLRSRLRR